MKSAYTQIITLSLLALVSCGRLERQIVEQTRGLDCSGAFPNKGEQLSLSWQVFYERTGKIGQELNEHEPLGSTYIKRKILTCNAGSSTTDPYGLDISDTIAKCSYPLHFIDRAIMILDFATQKVTGRYLDSLGATKDQAELTCNPIEKSDKSKHFL